MHFSLGDVTGWQKSRKWNRPLKQIIQIICQKMPIVFVVKARRRSYIKAHVRSAA